MPHLRSWLATAIIVLASGCASAGVAAESDEASGAVTVLAAASLSVPFQDLAEELAADPGLDVRLVFGPSTVLVEQVLAGAPADLLATADESTMATAAGSGLLAGEPEVFAHNVMVLAVHAGNPAGVKSMSDLARPDLRVALCEPQVPCGSVAADALDRAGVVAAPDTFETDVRNVTGKVLLGEVDAALIYWSDALAHAHDIEVIDVAGLDHVLTEYPVAVLSDAANPAGAEVFRSALLAEDGRRILAEAGFVVR